MAIGIEQLSINTIRTLSMDGVQKANSGHPGAPMGMAPVVYTLWQEIMNYNPADPNWANRDRFVLSIGHASMLIYSILHLTGVRQVEHGKPTSELAVPMTDIQRFRQLNSRCPGHPESHLTSGIETTTGPLGQGVATSVGMAIAQRWLATRYNRPGYPLFTYRIYSICGDGCMMEGVSSEAASLAAHLKLNNLCWIYDSNRITIDGSTSIAFTEDTAARFRAYGWNVLNVDDANDISKVRESVLASQQSDKPTFIVVKSHIAFGSPHKQDTSDAHGEPLGEEEIKLTKRNYGWPEDAKFLVPPEVTAHFQSGIGERGKKEQENWNRLFANYKNEYPELAKEVELLLANKLPEGWDKNLPVFPTDAKGIASRDSSGKVLNAIAQNVPWLLGGSADLAKSTKTRLTFKEAGDQGPEEFGGRNLHFGVREHGMTAIVNGLGLSKLKAFGSGFLIFSDYAKGSIRLSAIMELPVIHIFTHDSIGVGEDGPTHQPIEQLISLRAIPEMIVLRPGDANEVVEAWRYIMTVSNHPVSLILSRQALPTLDRTKFAPASELKKGGYILSDAPNGKPQLILIASGSEVSLAISAMEKLTAEGIAVRVVSMPSWELFERQSAEYREQVLPKNITARVSIEMSSTIGWDRYIGLNGKAVGMHSFGASAPIKDLQQHFGFTVEKVCEAAKSVL